MQSEISITPTPAFLSNQRIHQRQLSDAASDPMVLTGQAHYVVGYFVLAWMTGTRKDLK